MKDTPLGIISDDISDKVEEFIEQLKTITASELSESEMQELQLIIADFKEDISSCVNIEELAGKLKSSMESALVSDFKKDIEQKPKNDIERKNNETLGVTYDKLQRN